MRLKIQSLPPLPELKVWFTPDERCTTVANLKSALTSVLFAAAKTALELSLDGFDLLEGSPLHVLRDGDLVVVKAAAASKIGPNAGEKRKRSSSPNVDKKKRSRSSSSSSSDTSSSSYYSDSSGSSSSSSSSSSAASPILPPPRALVPKARTSVCTPSPHKSKSASTLTVAPGRGKPSTHARNARRKAKALALKTAVPAFVSASNAARMDLTDPAEPAWDRSHEDGNELLMHRVSTPVHAQDEAEETLQVQMMSMFPKSKNKNKSRRGVDTVDPRSRKIVFETTPPPPRTTWDKEARDVQPALIPPSSLAAHLLPVNVFVTSVDVEEGLKKPKGKKHTDYSEAENWAMGDVEPDVTVLDYGGPDPAKLEWDAAPLIASHVQLKKGITIGMEGLIMNMKTFTPELGKRYGRVVSWTEDIVTIQPFESSDGLGEDEILDWNEVEGKWKLFN
ncbi:hypothetical protein GGX14DRAFT_426095 [Mycena pura]|uniref:Coilin N-terminal domain-containing protein n=1 Tax=Mycena pura TaxID=153505 RepID=A0AAD7E2A3_9AGAR|nr:hypothetical protein GGX14DRAFT_426095 [Mycena pura]